jgi:hypothetical protein
LEAAKFKNIFKIIKGKKMNLNYNNKKHELKTDPYVFEEVFKDNKTFEIRYNDRNFEVNDILILKETKYTGAEMKSGAELIYTGRELTKRVSHVFKGPFYGLKENWVILSIKDID